MDVRQYFRDIRTNATSLEDDVRLDDKPTSAVARRNDGVTNETPRSFWDAYKRFWKNYATIKGRASRAEYWYVVACNSLIYIVLIVTGGFFGSLATGLDAVDSALAVVNAISLIAISIASDVADVFVSNESDEAAIMVGGYCAMCYMLATLCPSVCLGIRRLHDFNLSGWWYLLRFLPSVGGLIMFAYAVFEPTFGDNKYGNLPTRRT